MENRNALEPGFMLRQYRIERVIGQGGFGITYLAYDTDLKRPVAIKECFPRDFVFREGTTIVPTGATEKQNFSWALGKFVGEATTLARFKHPGIVQVLQILKDENDSAYMVLEYVEGQSLDKWLKGLGKQLDENTLKTVILPILDALEVIHENGIAHLDIAPDNIYIRNNGDAVLLDFGAAKQTVGQQTRTLNLVVKDGYSSPEQYYVEGKQGSWSDVYALAATLYRAIVGERPVDAMARLDAINNEEPDPLKSLASMKIPGFSNDFLKAVDQGMSARSKARPQTIREWRSSLVGNFTLTSEVSQPRKSTFERPDTKVKSKKNLAVVSILVLIAGAAIGGFLYDQKLKNEKETADWNATLFKDTISDYDQFAKKYPNSEKINLVHEAQAKLKRPWTKSFDNAETEQSNAITANNDSIIIVGTQVDKGGKGFQAFIKSVSLGGKVRWHSVFGEDDNETFEDAVFLPNGDIIVVGNTSKTFSLKKAIIARYSETGERVWVKQIDGNSQSAFNAVKLLKNGDLIAVGTIKNPSSGTDGWAVKLDTNGNVKTTKSLGGNGNDGFADVAEMHNGHLAFVGQKQRSGGNDANFWLVKTSPDGKVLLDRTPGGPRLDQFHSVAATKSGELIIVGVTTSFGSNSVDSIIMRLTADNKLPPKIIADPKDDYLSDVSIASDGGIIVAGYTFSKGAGRSDGWVTKYNSELTEILWERVIGTSNVEAIYGLEVISDGSIIIAGSAQKNGNQNSDVWVLRLGSRGQYDGI